MANALKTTDDPAWATEKAARKTKGQRANTRTGTLASQTFEELSPQDKDLLLKQVGVQLGLIADSD